MTTYPNSTGQDNTIYGRVDILLRLLGECPKRL